MDVKLSPRAAKYLKRLSEPMKSRIKDALAKLSAEPPAGDIKSLAGKNGYRLRVGKYRVLFDRINDDIVVYDIDVRGDIYKGANK